MYKSKIILFVSVFALMLAPFKIVEARGTVSIVGSSTVFPFSAVVAEEFGRGSAKTPVVEATGSGGGAKLFCSGIGLEYPDITNSSRRMKKSEYDDCQSNGIDMTEVVIGFDGIVVANANSGPKLNLTIDNVFKAVAAKVPGPNATDDNCKLINNPYTSWSQIDSSLPNIEIEILGPPPTSGTRDAFAELAMEGGAENIPCLSTLKKEDKEIWKAVVYGVREDGAWIDAGENDNLMVSKLNTNPDAVGVFGFSFLDQNSDSIKGAIINNIEPTFENIAGGDYKISRSLFFYIKHAHVGVVPGIQEYAQEFTTEDAFGEDGYLVDKGLIPLPDEDRAKYREATKTLPKLVL
jgi:phosphate transport system substrate-binding protein